jgi:DNA-binding CsgD family transcriptional regulator
MGNIGAMVRAARSATPELRKIPKIALPELTPQPNVEPSPKVSDTVQRQRKLVAMFCKMLGDQVSEGKPAEIDGPPMAPRQRQTLELLLNGNAEKEIAARLAISRHTVHVYVKSLYKRFGVSSRAELLARWVQR